MTAEQLKSKIKLSIQAFNNADSLSDISIQFFESLGYNTDRKAKMHKPDFKEFKDTFIENKIFDNKKAKSNEWKYVDILFQLTKEEVLNQNSLFDIKKVDSTIIETYLFFVIELNNKIYSKGELSLITREVNRLFPMPVMILFKHGSSLTLSVINRRLHKRDESKDVLEKVTLIKDIYINEPHRAHIEILFDLSFEKLKEKFNFTNFVELHNAWQKTLDTKELNKKFYEKLFSWYLWALKHVKFPQIRAEDDMLIDEIHQSESLIRLLTRILFVWFMKEKGLINNVLFDSKKLKNILKKFEGENGEETIYYKAILQNLFFATLNKPIEQRKVIDKGFNKNEYGDPLVYRFDDLFIEPKNFIKLFDNIPFLNGGLFECLDRKKDNDNPVEIRLDGFSTTKYKQPIVPDKLFFGEYKNIDLSQDFDDKKKNKQTVYGLIDILNQYKFTIEENTPIEEEVALDPELLGKVFENLLASYNPETKTTARKQTGSFYTPREIVNYMVDESIIAYLKNHIDDEERLRQLLSYNKSETENPFNEKETNTLLKAIDSCKILDPACGSGAFPMGILQKMIFILHKLDPENKLWFDMVVENIPAYMRDEFRKRLKKESWNYVRKLGIIQQCIYGVDIQPIATQIAKLRFFISLLVDQDDKPNEPNRGFEPLPNLDFKIVTANTLISAPASDVKSEGLFEDQQDPFFEKFDKLTEQYFTASIEEDKKKLRKAITALINKKCEEKIEEIESSYAAEDERVKKALKEKKKELIAAKENEIKLWRSYPNIFKHESVGFFEPRYFFPKVKDGFDIVIGNPPYVLLQDKVRNDLQITYFRKFYSVASYKVDLYHLFFEKSINLIHHNGVSTLITPSNFLSNNYTNSLRRFLLTKTELLKIIIIDSKVFEADVNNSVIICKATTDVNRKACFYSASNIANFFPQKLYCLSQKEILKEKDCLLVPLSSFGFLSLSKKIENSSRPLSDFAFVKFGMQLRNRKHFTSDVLESPSKSQLTNYHKKCFTGGDIRKYIVSYNNLYCFFNIKAKRGGCWDENFHYAKPKILVRQIGLKPIAGVDLVGYPVLNSAFMIVCKNLMDSFYLLGLINSSLLQFYWLNKFGDKREQFPKIKGTYLELLPVKFTIESIYEKLSELVKEIIESKKQNPTADTSELEKEIDRLVYKLYGLTEEEIAIIEESVK